MTYRYFAFIAAVFLALQACGDKKLSDADKALSVKNGVESSSEASSQNKDEPQSKEETEKVTMDGRITLYIEPLISEEAACILPIKIANGTEKPASVSMFGFKVSGPKVDDSANMFAQPTPSGEIRLARVILLGHSCADYDTITVSEYLCAANDDDCADMVDFIGSPDLNIISP